MAFASTQIDDRVDKFARYLPAIFAAETNELCSNSIRVCYIVFQETALQMGHGERVRNIAPRIPNFMDPHTGPGSSQEMTHHHR